MENTAPLVNMNNEEAPTIDAAVALTKPGQSQSEVILVGGNASLQDSFKKFRSQKIKERKILQQCRDDRATTGPRSEAAKDELRSKFVEQAKKYIGVPYAERYKAPEAPIAPLYLDCCALVRKAVQDLQEDFGFVIGRWNQCYQMDTLPIVIEQHQLKPGDLIFYEGIFNSNRSRPQKHNNVHVEIFLGGETGELVPKVLVLLYRFYLITFTCSLTLIPSKRIRIQ